jgi:hypothetical protein
MLRNPLLRRALAAALAAVLSVGVLVSQRAEASQPGSFGSTTGYSPGGYFVWQSSADLNADLDAMVASGASWVRVDLGWASVEGTKGSYNWGAYDNLVNAVNAHGLNLMFILAYAPSWATGCGGTDKCMPAASNVGSFGAFAGAAAARYKGRVAAYEVLNEANMTWSAGTPDPARYTAMAKAAYPAVKAGDPSATVVVGAAAPSSTSGGQYSPLDWAKALWANGINGSFDAWSAHPYTYPALPEAPNTQSWSAWWSMIDIHNYLASVGRPEVKMWMTEFGSPTRGRGLADGFQRDTILAGLDKAAGYNWAGPLFIYSVRDTGPVSDANPESAFGLLNKDRSPKTAWQPVTNKLHAARPGAPTPPSTTPPTTAPPTTTTPPTTAPPTTTTPPTTAPPTTTTPPTTAPPTTAPPTSAPPTTAPPTTTPGQGGYEPSTDARVQPLLTKESAAEARYGDLIRAYRGVLGRLPDTGGLTSWANSLSAPGGPTVASMMNSMASSSEFTWRYGNLSNDAFVTRVYLNTFGRNPTTVELASARAVLARGTSRGTVAAAIINADTGKAAAANRVQAVASYMALLNRVPTAAEERGWTASGPTLAWRLARLGGVVK